MRYPQIGTVEELGELLGQPAETARTKERPKLSEHDRAWLAATPFCVLATSDADGNCDARCCALGSGNLTPGGPTQWLRGP